MLDTRGIKHDRLLVIISFGEYYKFMLEIIVYLALLSPFFLLYYLRNKETKWVWLFFILIALSSGIIRFKDEGLTAIRSVLIIISLIMSIVKTKKEGYKK